MNLDRARRLEAEGFERVAVRQVALPHAVWKVDLVVEVDRSLTLAEETILRLVESGVGASTDLSRLMGLDPGVIVPATVVNLLAKGLLSHVDKLEVTPLGRQALRVERTRAQHEYSEVQLRYDPYRDAFVWNFDVFEYRDGKAVRGAGLYPLPQPVELTGLEVETRHAEVQDLLDRFGLPFDKPETSKKKLSRDIVRLRARHSYRAWRAAELEVWYSGEREEWQWRLLYGGGEDEQISDVLRRLQADGTEILPLEKMPREAPLSPVGNRVHRSAQEVRERSGTGVLHGEEHRQALREAIAEARKELIIVSPWLRSDAVDNELIGWLEAALRRHKGLRITVGYGIERDTGKQDWQSRDQRRALSRLNKLGNRNRGRLRTVEIGNTHEKVILVDRRYAIVTSFNFLSFNPKPGRGIRRETGLLVEDKNQVAALRASLADDLKLR